MGVCPKCGYEYQPHVFVCPDCGARLVASEQAEPEAGAAVEAARVDPELARQKLVAVHRGYDEQSVRHIHAALQAERVRATVRSFVHPVSAWPHLVGGSLNGPLGAWGEVLVLEQDVQRAAEIIDAVHTGTIVPDDAAGCGESL